MTFPMASSNDVCYPMMSNALPEIPPHPYYPLGVAIPGFVAKKLATPVILTIFATTCLAVLGPTWFYTRRVRPDLPASEIFAVLWFVLCACIHMGLEGYFALTAHTIATRTTLLSQMWKEYALSDSRYLTADAFVVSMETVTAVFWGPLSLVCAWCILRHHPLRHPLQSIISLGQLYGDVLYYATTFVGVVEYSRPEAAYYWGYFVLMNAFWIVIPGFLLFRSTQETVRGFESLKKIEGVKENLKTLRRIKRMRGSDVNFLTKD